MRYKMKLFYAANCTIFSEEICHARSLRILGIYGKISAGELREREATKMSTVPKYYTTLFNAVTDVLRELEQHNYGNATDLLMHGQLQAEGEYTAWMEEQKKS